MTTIIRDILQDLERTRENMLALSDDIWLSIDHNDPDSLKEGVAFKEEYNSRMTAFDRLTNEISELVQQYTQVRLEVPEAEKVEESEQERNARVVRELNREDAHCLDEDFTFKRPCGYALQGKAFNGLTTWRGLFEHVCRNLYDRDSTRFREVAIHADFQTRRGNRYFSHSEEGLRLGAVVVPGIFAEINLSANSLRNVIKLLLNHFDLPLDSVVIYLRQDRDATSTE